MELGLKNKYVFISGSTNGIGLATAKAFLEEGAICFINGRNEVKLKEIQAELKNIYGDRVHAICGDMTVEEDVIKAVKEVLKISEIIDIFVANIGNGKPETKDYLDYREWERFFEINEKSVVLCLQKFYNMIKRSKESSVTLVSSVVARQWTSAPVGYAAAKNAILTINRYLSNLWAKDGIRVNCVMPGNVYFEGGRWEELLSKDKIGVENYIDSEVPLKRFGKPEEVASAIVFLSSCKSSFTTGSVLNVDGGQQRAL